MHILSAVGGLGLFLLGMLILTDGLRKLAGSSLRKVLARFTRTPLSGAITGALTTAVIQSSSATTVIAVGFVGAGLLSFSHALGIIFGANIGTTVTGWLVAVLGFKLNLGSVVLPVIFLGTVLKLFGRGRVEHFGWALAGFSLLFIGIDAMQEGMTVFSGSVTPDDFPRDTLLGRVQLVLTGMAITLVTQSSSAGVAAALVALDAGAISFAQAAAMVIGMDIGTTFKTALATIGGSTAMRQTGYAHVIYNMMTGVVAFFLLTPYTALLVHMDLADSGSAQLALVGFHTMFNTLGVILVIPVAVPFARLMIWLVPGRGPQLLQRLDSRLIAQPAAAIDAVIATTRDIAVELFAITYALSDVRARRSLDPERLIRVGEALDATRHFLEQVRTESDQKTAKARHLAAVHVMDHLTRLFHRCTQEDRIKYLQADRRPARLTALLRCVLSKFANGEIDRDFEYRLERLYRILDRQSHKYRVFLMDDAARGTLDSHATLRRLDSARWLYRTAYHFWRIVHHLRAANALSALPLPDINQDKIFLAPDSTSP